ncbi:MAG TPA: ABC transporter permease, partial [Mariniflexile sp.]
MPKKTTQPNNASLNILSFIPYIKEKSIQFFIDIANVLDYLKLVSRNFFTKKLEFEEFLKQCYQIGNKSVGLISVTGIIVGLVLTIQSRPPLVEFGAVAMLPGMVAISLIREMGPVITALICAGKIGSSMGAELGSMRVSEQIDAMEVSNT